jgi:TRAP-type mannitol/chloroaromatic compound transport system permease small subunit
VSVSKPDQAIDEEGRGEGVLSIRSESDEKGGLLPGFLRVADKCSEYSGRISSYLIWPLFFIIIFEVIARRVFHSPTSYSLVLSRFIHGGYVLMGGAYCLLHRAHAFMPLIHDRLSPRKQALLDLITSIFFFGFCGILFWETVQFCWEATMRNECVFEAWRAPRWPYMWMVPVAIFLLILQGVAKFIRDISTLIKGEKWG